MERLPSPGSAEQERVRATVMSELIGAVLAQDDQQLFLGEDFLPWMVLALGAALVVGPVFALVRPPKDREPESAPPVGRSIAMIVIGAIAAIWGLASLLT